ncbi:hypothetical protein BRADI_1g40732v3 [Brachypodium distachyon]|uniref:Uncharacterized protein n=1 Tax=Brachypodium distachyon TaxID=15368 RepID=A0A2K2DNP1_BRADI|nr:hypothetical protein BRADI_1g40732v3 [Brachypodium distachyon]
MCSHGRTHRPLSPSALSLVEPPPLLLSSSAPAPPAPPPLPQRCLARPRAPPAAPPPPVPLRRAPPPPAVPAHAAKLPRARRSPRPPLPRPVLESEPPLPGRPSSHASLSPVLSPRDHRASSCGARPAASSSPRLPSRPLLLSPRATAPLCSFCCASPPAPRQPTSSPAPPQAPGRASLSSITVDLLLDLASSTSPAGPASPSPSPSPAGPWPSSFSFFSVFLKMFPLCVGPVCQPPAACCYCHWCLLFCCYATVTTAPRVLRGVTAQILVRREDRITSEPEP